MNHRIRFAGRVVVVAALLIAVLALPQLMLAANTVVTPSNPDGWAVTDLRTDATIGITEDNPRSGLGSLKFTTNTVTSGQDKADFTKTWSVPTRTLGTLSDVSFEFYRDATSTTTAHFGPVLRLIWWQDNAPTGATPGPEDNTGYLIWEQIYNGINPVPTNSWQSANLFTTGYFWMRLLSGPNTSLPAAGCGRTIENFSVTLNDWLTGNPQGGPGNCTAPDIDANTYIVGVNTGVGSGWGGTFLGYSDNVVVAFGADVVSANFEPNPKCAAVCYVDDTGSDANDGMTPATALKTIQKGIDLVQAGGEVRVLPGTYDQDEKNGVDPATGGAGGNDFNIFVNKANITIQGVTAADVDITTAAAAVANIEPKRAVPTFGVSTMFVQADGVTIQGVKFFAQNGPVQAAKTVEVIGNDVTIDGTAFDTTAFATGVYISDFAYDTGTDTSTVPDYAFTNNHFTSTAADGVGIYVASGAGWPDNVGTRTISGNTFINLDDAVVFAGPGSAGWLLYPVGAADITGNTFSQIARRHVLAFGNYPTSGTALGYAEPDWCGIMASNTFDKGTMLWAGTTTCPTGLPRRWESGSFKNVAGLYSAIQQYGVNRAVAGDLLQVMPGAYVEQVTVNKSMTLVGANKATTIIKAPATIPNSSTQDSIIVKITGAGVNVDFSGFTVSGPGPTGCGSMGYGIFVRDGAYANIHDNKVVDIRDNPVSGCQNGNAIGVGRNLWSTSGTADITDNEITGYQKTGIIVDNAGSSANIEGNTVSGDGPISYIAENGIQVSRGATAEIVDNTITGHSYSPFTATSAGILFYQAGVTNTDGNTLTNNQIGLNSIDSSGTHQNNNISATAVGTSSPGFWGIVVDAPPPGRVPSPFDGETDVIQATAGPTPPVGVQTVVVTGNTLTSNNSAGGVGLEADAGYGALNISLTATKNIIHNWEYGVVIWECVGSCAPSTYANVAIHRNSIVGNSNGLFADTADATVTDATCNWWGAASGPSGEGTGTGDSVSTEADFDPWLSSSNLDGPCGPGYLLSAEAAGTTDDGIVYGPEDILLWDEGTSTWSKWFDGTFAGLTPNGKAMHNIVSTYIPNPAQQVFYATFAQNARVVPGITGKVDGMDIVKYDGGFTLFFDGSDVGLNLKTPEKIDALHFLDPGLWPYADVCQYYLLISTQGPGHVAKIGGGKLKFSGEDILGFCATSVGSTTAGKWFMFLDGSTQGMPKHSLSGLSASADGQTIYLTTKGNFNVDTASGGHSMVYVYNVATQSFSGPVFQAAAEGLPTRVDALDIVGN